jgi:cysteinyl-tRNA synthetase
MKLYNTLTRSIEEVMPQRPPDVTIYTCGPTVYDYYHIGNLRNAVFNDTLRRTLAASDYEAKHVMNITDVGHLVSDADEGEDKLEKGAQREGKTVWEVAEHYTQAFKDDMAAMNVLEPNAYHSSKYNDNYARATDFIEQQLTMVKLLLEKEFAYQTKQAVYFDVTKLPDYGVLTGQRLADKEVGVRTDVVTDPDKRHPHDFAVWFFAVGHFSGHTMQWESPWGSGFPGWHLECSAIIHTTLGDPIDIHTGGVDHIGTHHPNEMAQSEAAFGHPLAHLWVHNEFILVDGTKMSKSKHNSFTLQDIKSRGFEPLALRLLYLQAHYRSELNFSWEGLTAAKNRLQSYRAMADLRFQPIDHDSTDAALFNEAWKDMLQATQADLGTPQVLEKLSSLEAVVADTLVTQKTIPAFETFLGHIDGLLGLQLLESADITPDQKSQLRARQQARDNKQWEASDDLRRQLEQQGIGLRDTPHGQMWYRR